MRYLKRILYWHLLITCDDLYIPQKKMHYIKQVLWTAGTTHGQCWCDRSEWENVSMAFLLDEIFICINPKTNTSQGFLKVISHQVFVRVAQGSFSGKKDESMIHLIGEIIPKIILQLNKKSKHFWLNAKNIEPWSFIIYWSLRKYPIHRSFKTWESELFLISNWN